MGKCIVKSCRSRTQIHKKEDGVHFHQIPKDPMRRNEWIKAIRLLRCETDWIPSSRSVICSLHFKEEHFILSEQSNRRTLAKDAVPLIPNENPTSPTQFEYWCEPVCEPQCEPFEDVDDSEVEEIVEPPMQNKMRMKIERLERIASSRLKKLEAIRKKSERLERSNEKLKNIIVMLKKKLVEHNIHKPGDIMKVHLPPSSHI